MAPASDNLAMTDIAQAFDTNGFEVVDAAWFDYQATSLRANLMVIGRTCENTVALALEDNVDLCENPESAGIKQGMGMIALYEKQGGVQVLITGYSAEDTRRAAKVYAQYVDDMLKKSSSIFEIRGTRVFVVGTNDNPVVVLPIENSPIEKARGKPSGNPRDWSSAKADEPSPIKYEGSFGKDSCNSGCSIGGRCVPIGTRLAKEKNLFCSVEGTLEVQQELETACQNNYECGSNQCANARCADLERQLAEAQTILDKIKSWLGWK